MLVNGTAVPFLYMCAAYINLPFPFISNPTSPLLGLFHLQAVFHIWGNCAVCASTWLIVLHMMSSGSRHLAANDISFFLCGWLVLCHVYTTFKNSVYMVLHSGRDVIPGCHQATLWQLPWELLTPDKSSLCTSRPCGNCTEEPFSWCKAGVKEACRGVVTMSVDEGFIVLNSPPRCHREV